MDVFCINIRSVAGWLFSINAGKVRPALREKLVQYQRECADVLADHFLGRRGDADIPDELREAAAVLPGLVQRVVGDKPTLGAGSARCRVPSKCTWLL